MPHVDAGNIGKEIEDFEKIKNDLYAAIAKVKSALFTVPGTPALMTVVAVGSSVPTVTAKLPKLILIKIVFLKIYKLKFNKKNSHTTKLKKWKTVGIEKKQKNKMGCPCNSDSLIILIL